MQSKEKVAQHSASLYISDNMSIRRNYLGEGDNADVVTFEYVRPSYDVAPGTEFAASLASKHGINMLHAVPKAADWYHYDDQGAWLSSIASACTPDTLGFGSSMGGYAIAHFADALGIKRGLCISPQFSIHREIVPFEHRWDDHAARIKYLRNDAILNRKGLIWILYDSKAKDRFHAEMLAETGPCEMIGIPYGGHPVGFAMSEAGVLTLVVDMFIKGQENRSAIIELLAAIPHRSPTYHMNKGNMTSDPEERERCYLRGLSIDPKHQNIRQAYGTFLLHKRRVTEAEGILSPLMGQPRFARHYARVCEQIGVTPRLLNSASLISVLPAAGLVRTG